MQKDIFDACMDYYLNKPVGTTWDSLNDSLTHPYPNGESLRSAFKRARKSLKLIPQKQEPVKQFPKIVCFDIELSPMIVYTFDIFSTYINPDNVILPQFMLSWSGKILNDSKVYSDVATPEEVFCSDDSRITKSMWEFLNGSQIVIGHNVKDFDMRVANTRFLLNHLPPLSPYQVIDTLKVAKTNFMFESNQLKYINKQLGIRQKIENGGMSLWVKCMEGNQEALTELDTYCQGDVLAVEELYYKFRPFIQGHPNLSLFSDDKDSACPNCGSNDTISNGYYFTTTGKYESVRCNHCGAISRRRKDILDKEKKQNLLRN